MKYYHMIRQHESKMMIDVVESLKATQVPITTDNLSQKRPYRDSASHRGDSHNSNSAYNATHIPQLASLD